MNLPKLNKNIQDFELWNVWDIGHCVRTLFLSWLHKGWPQVAWFWEIRPLTHHEVSFAWLFQPTIKYSIIMTSNNNNLNGCILKCVKMCLQWKYQMRLLCVSKLIPVFTFVAANQCVNSTWLSFCRETLTYLKVWRWNHCYQKFSFCTD